MSEYIKNRFYLRFDWRRPSALGVLNTVLAWLFNRVLVKHVEAVTGCVVRWSIGRGTDFKPAPASPFRVDDDFERAPDSIGAEWRGVPARVDIIEQKPAPASPESQEDAR